MEAKADGGAITMAPANSAFLCAAFGAGRKSPQIYALCDVVITQVLQGAVNMDRACQPLCRKAAITRCAFPKRIGTDQMRPSGKSGHAGKQFCNLRFGGG